MKKVIEINDNDLLEDFLWVYSSDKSAKISIDNHERDDGTWYTLVRINFEFTGTELEFKTKMNLINQERSKRFDLNSIKNKLNLYKNDIKFNFDVFNEIKEIIKHEIKT